MIVTYPGSDMARRADQLFENIQFIQRELDVSQIEMLVLDYRTEKWESGSELKRQLGVAKDAMRLIWVYGFEDILRDGRKDLIIELQNVYRDGNKRLVLVCEANFYDVAFEKLILSLPSFDPRISFHGSYQDAQLREFIDYLANKWELTLKEKFCATIIDGVGSNLRLIKLIMWHLRDKGIDKVLEALESPQVWWQARSIWHKLSENEKKVVLAHVYGLQKSEDLAMSREYIEKMRLLEMPILEKFVRKHVGNPLEVNVENDRLLIGGKDCSDYFTDKQKIILKKVLANPGECIAREKMINEVWGQDTEVGSDWALDSQINRLRQRLQEAGIGKQHLSTRRGRGLVWLSQ